jgi:hypothetical protein
MPAGSTAGEIRRGQRVVVIAVVKVGEKERQQVVVLGRQPRANQIRDDTVDTQKEQAPETQAAVADDGHCAAGGGKKQLPLDPQKQRRAKQGAVDTMLIESQASYLPSARALAADLSPRKEGRKKRAVVVASQMSVSKRAGRRYDSGMAVAEPSPRTLGRVAALARRAQTMTALPRGFTHESSRPVATVTSAATMITTMIVFAVGPVRLS